MPLRGLLSDTNQWGGIFSMASVWPSFDQPWPPDKVLILSARPSFDPLRPHGSCSKHLRGRRRNWHKGDEPLHCVSLSWPSTRIQTGSEDTWSRTSSSSWRGRGGSKSCASPPTSFGTTSTCKNRIFRRGSPRNESPDRLHRRPRNDNLGNVFRDSFLKPWSKFWFFKGKKCFFLSSFNDFWRPHVVFTGNFELLFCF